MFDNASEKRAYQFFYEKAAPELSDYFDTPFWNSFVMQASRANPAVKYSVLAIGAAYESVLQRKDLLQKTSLDSAETLCLRQANKAIEHLVAQPEKTSLSVVLLCSVLFYHLGFLMPGTGSLAHLNQGLRIIREYKTSGGRSSLQSGEIELVEDHLIPLMTRLGGSLGSVLDPAHSVSQSFVIHSMQKLLPNELQEPLVPEHFGNLHHAKDCLMYILQWVLAGIYRRVRLGSYKSGQQHGQDVLSVFQKWRITTDLHILELDQRDVRPALTQVRHLNYLTAD